MNNELNEEEQINEALDAIHDTALNLLAIEDIDELHRGLEIIVSLARYKSDIRNSADRKFGEESDEI